MMSISDILQLVVLCLLIFLPLGYIAHHFMGRIKMVIRLLLLKPRYVKPAGTLRRAPLAKADLKYD